MKFKLVESIDDRLVEEVLEEELLEEGTDKHWFLIDFLYNGNPHQVAIFASDSSRAEKLLRNPDVVTKTNHEMLNKANLYDPILISNPVTVTDLGSSYLPRKYFPLIYNLTDSGLRSVTDDIVDSIGSVQALLNSETRKYYDPISKKNLNFDKLYNHHESGTEINTFRDDLIEIPYSSKDPKGLKNAAFIHEVIHKLGFNSRHGATTYNYPVYIYDRSAGKHIRKIIKIEII